jgi:Holliday junction resolvase RusA-like endonuclease
MFKHHTQIVIMGKPQPTERVRFDGRRAYKPSKTREAMNRRIWAIRRHIATEKLETISDQPISVEIDFFHTRPKTMRRKKDSQNPLPKTSKPDVDNLAKLALDCCTQASLWADDDLISRLVIRDWWAGIDDNRQSLPAKTVILVQTYDNRG